MGNRSYLYGTRLRLLLEASMAKIIENNNLKKWEYIIAKQRGRLFSKFQLNMGSSLCLLVNAAIFSPRKWETEAA
jgi:hypothetical protein